MGKISWIEDYIAFTTSNGKLNFWYDLKLYVEEVMDTLPLKFAKITNDSSKTDLGTVKDLKEMDTASATFFERYIGIYPQDPITTSTANMSTHIMFWNKIGQIISKETYA